MFLQRVVIQVTKVDITGYLDGKSPSRRDFRGRRILPRVAEILLVRLGPSECGKRRRQTENLEFHGGSPQLPLFKPQKGLTDVSAQEMVRLRPFCYPPPLAAQPLPWGRWRAETESMDWVQINPTMKGMKLRSEIADRRLRGRCRTFYVPQRGERSVFRESSESENQ